jgi:hypothetical protein
LRVRVRPYVVAVGQMLMSVMTMLDADDARRIVANLGGNSDLP